MAHTFLGKLEPVDVKTVWENEASDFTPWLAQEDNLALLSETIGLELELQEQEKQVGRYRADLLCRDTTTDQWVLIENQLEKTNHRHLGQLLTYAAGLEAVTIVWIAQAFNDEHRAALDWLNEITDERFNFFGLEIESWRIGESEIAPKFNVFCKPNEWTKGGGGGAVPDEDNATRLEFWKEFREFALKQEPRLKPRKATSKARLIFQTGRKGVSLHTRITQLKGGMLGVSLSIRGKHAKAYFEVFKAQQQEIETELRVPVDWVASHGQKIYQVRTQTPGKIEDHDKWPQYRDWLLKTLVHFQRVFADRIAALPVVSTREADEEYADDDE